MNFLFWNISGKDLAKYAAELAQTHDIDLLVLAESHTSPSRILRALNSGREVRWAFAATPVPLKNGLQLYVRGASSFVIPKFDLPRVSIRQVQFPASAPFTLAIAHLQSPMYLSEDDRASAAAQVVSVIRQIEMDVGHTRTVVIGDLNMDPFSKGLVSADAFNAVMTRDIASGELRSIGNQPYYFFFNPTWQLFNDGGKQPAATYYYRNPGFSSLNWHVYDQVLVRPRLMNAFDASGLKVLDHSPSGPLHDGHGYPQISHHFPIKFKLSI
jgi:hypothetical protein